MDKIGSNPLNLAANPKIRLLLRPHRLTQKIAIIALALISIGFQSAPASFAQGVSRGSAAWSQQGNDLTQLALSLVNDDRARGGSPAVRQDAALSHLAQVYAEFLLRTGSFGHIDSYGRSPEDRARIFGIGEPVAENLAWQESSFEEPSLLVRRAEAGMIGEPPGQFNHRYNILDPRNRYAGIGVARAGDKVILVQEFAADKP